MAETEATALLAAFQEQASGLLFPSESDYPLVPFIWKKEEIGASALTPELVLRQAKHAAKTPVETQDVKTFFTPATEEEDWYDAEDRAMAMRFQSLQKTLEARLHDLRVYKLGDAEKEVYIVGKTMEGDFAGVSTKVVET